MTNNEQLIYAEDKYLKGAHLAGRLLDAQEQSRFFEINKEITHEEYMRRVQQVEGVLIQFYVHGRLLARTIKSGGEGELTLGLHVTMK